MEALRRRYQQQPPRSHFGWLGLLIAVFLGYLFAHFSDRNRSAPDPVERYRLAAAIASPMPSPTPVVRDYAPRAELVQNDFAPRPVGDASTSCFAERTFPRARACFSRTSTRPISRLRMLCGSR
jgi:hypothetical protein